MIFTTHMAAAALTTYVINSGTAPETALLTCAAAAGCSLLPDIDIGTSKIACLCRPAAYTIQFVCGHRGVFHSPLLWSILFFLLSSRFPQYQIWILSAACGVGSHLLLDILNPAGIPVLWPMRKKFAIGIFRTGGLLDILLGLFLWGVLIYLFTTTDFSQ